MLFLDPEIVGSTHSLCQNKLSTKYEGSLSHSPCNSDSKKKEWTSGDPWTDMQKVIFVQEPNLGRQMSE